MTKQIKEIVTYKDQDYGINDRPLDPYLDEIIKEPLRLPFMTSCWRGYQGFWGIKDDKLYLNRVEGHGIRFVFTRCSDLNLFAEWYTGEINIPIGEEVKCNFKDEAYNHEEYLVLEFKNGVLQNSRILNNRDYIEKVNKFFEI